VVLSTNCADTDEYFSSKNDPRLRVVWRMNEIPERECSMKEVIRNWWASVNGTPFVLPEGAEYVPPQGHICLLYMTYVNRLSSDIDKMVRYYLQQPDKPMIGMIADEPMHPYRFLEYKASSDRVMDIFQNQTHVTRRQEYPRMYPFSHYACMFDLEVLSELSPNLIGSRTRPYWLTKAQCVDMDTARDMEILREHRSEYYEKLINGGRDV